ncbi:hypothetical protein [Mycolicibacterium senegalense]|uniref:hypothetical protein n=1 Tax=Mycolicibacterium senegalense TaxID=1796 RepID=UPI0036433787
MLTFSGYVEDWRSVDVVETASGMLDELEKQISSEVAELVWAALMREITQPRKTQELVEDSSARSEINASGPLRGPAARVYPYPAILHDAGNSALIRRCQDLVLADFVAEFEAKTAL